MDLLLLLLLFLLFGCPGPSRWVFGSRVLPLPPASTQRARRMKYHSEYTHLDCPLVPYAGSAGILGEADRAICFYPSGEDPARDRPAIDV